MNEWAVPGYTELKTLGSGGFGAVVLATHDATGTAVAVKYLLPELRQDPDFTAMFRAEAEALGALDDPHVVRLYEYVESAAGAAIVMELVDGVTLWDILSRHGRTTPEAALAVLFGSLLGLAAAHARGVVHRDYKPRNVLINAYGASKLTDFGIAARAGTPTVPSGSVAYAPPEQFDGGPASPASDVYAATATFYECLAGHPPFTGATIDTVIELHRSASVPMEPVPAPLRPLVARGMAKDPAYRPADAAALAAELRAAAAGAYGPDWEQRGRSSLGEAALLLALLWPTAGMPALQGSAVEQVHLAHGSHSAQAAHAQAARHAHATQAELHRWHLRHILHLDHLAHLRYLRRERAADARPSHAGGVRKASRAARHLQTAATAVTAAAVVAAGLTVALTSRAPSGPGSPAHPAVAAYPVPLAPPQAREAFTLSEGGAELGYHAFSLGSSIHIAVAHFPPNTVVKYTCTTGSSFYEGTAGTTYDTDTAGATVRTGASGSASFDSAYSVEGGMSATCTSNNVSHTFTMPMAGPPGATLTVTQGAADAGCAGQLEPRATAGCTYIHLVAADFPANSIVNYGCTDVLDAGDAVDDHNSSGAVVVTDARGYASFDTSLAVPPGGFTSGSVPLCTSDNVSGAYGG